MDRGLTERLCTDFLELYRARTKRMTESPMCFGFECGDGWYRIIEQLSADIMRLAVQAGIDVHEVRQVKEKFGGLRFYIDGGSQTIYDRIDEAAELLLRTCEVCGEQGSRRGRDWIQTLCEEHSMLGQDEHSF